MWRQAVPQLRRTRCWRLTALAAVVMTAGLVWSMHRGATAEPLSDQGQPKAEDTRKLKLGGAKLSDDNCAELSKDCKEGSGWLTGALGLTAGVAGTLLSIWGTRLARHDNLDQSIHERRLDVYPALVQETEVFAIYFPSALGVANRIGPKECRQMGEAISRWYFQKGGLLLSTTARDAHLNLATALSRASRVEKLRTPGRDDYAEWISRQKLDTYRASLKTVHGLNLADSEAWRFGEDHTEGEPPELRFKDYVFLQGLSSQLRTCLTEDLRSRLRPD